MAVWPRRAHLLSLCVPGNRGPDPRVGSEVIRELHPPCWSAPFSHLEPPLRWDVRDLGHGLGAPTAAVKTPALRALDLICDQVRALRPGTQEERLAASRRTRSRKPRPDRSRSGYGKGAVAGWVLPGTRKGSPGGLP